MGSRRKTEGTLKGSMTKFGKLTGIRIERGPEKGQQKVQQKFYFFIIRYRYINSKQMPFSCLLHFSVLHKRLLATVAMTTLLSWCLFKVATLLSWQG